MIKRTFQKRPKDGLTMVDTAVAKINPSVQLLTQAYGKIVLWRKVSTQG